MLSSLSPIWFMDPPGEEDENHPPLPLSWQLAKAGPAGGLHSGTWKMFVFLLHLPQSVSLEWDGRNSVETLAFFVVFSPPHVHGRHRLQLLEFFLQAGSWFVCLPLEA